LISIKKPPETNFQVVGVKTTIKRIAVLIQYIRTLQPFVGGFSSLWTRLIGSFDSNRLNPNLQALSYQLIHKKSTFIDKLQIFIKKT